MLFGTDGIRGEVVDSPLDDEEAISQLPEILRSIVVMKSIDGLTYPEIADVTGVNEQTLKNRMFRARKQLAVTLKQMGVDQ